MRIALFGVLLLFIAYSASSEVTDDGASDPFGDAHRLLERAKDEPVMKYELTQQVLQQANRGLEQTRDDPIQNAEWLQVIWHYHLVHDNHAAASEALELALERLSSADTDGTLTVTILSNLSYSLILLGHVAEAKDYLRRAVVIAREEKHNESLFGIYYSLGDAYRKTGELLVARRYFEAAADLLADSDDHYSATATQLKLGSLARDEGRFPEAIEQHQRALKYFEQENKYREVVAEIELARDYLASGNFERGILFARSALGKRDALVEQKSDAAIVLLRAINDKRSANAASAADVAEAEELVNSTQALLQASIDAQRAPLARPVRQVRFAAEAIRHFSAAGDLAEVARLGNRANWLVREVAGGLQQHHEDYLAWMAEAQPTLNEYVRSLFVLDRDSVFDLLEDNYGRSIASPTLRNSAFAGGAFEAREIEHFDEYLAAESALVDASAAVHRRSILDANALDKEKLTQLKRQRDLTRDAYLAAKARYPDEQMQLLRPKSDGAVIRATIAEGDLYLRYFVHDEVSFVAVLGQGKPYYFELPARFAVRELVNNAHATLQVGQTHGKEHLESLTTLSQLLPPEILTTHTNARRLIIVPDDAVHLVPFSAINLAGDESEYTPLVDRYEVVRTFSAASYYADRADNPRDAAPGHSDIVIFADPVFSAKSVAIQYPQATISQWANQLKRLPYTAREAADIEQIFASRTVKTYLGDEATSNILLSEATRTAKVLHIATHGYFDESTPGIVGIATSPIDIAGSRSNGFLSLTELLSRPFLSNLVIVSGCETMRGQHYRGQGVQSMAHGFLARGAGSVVGTLWKVPDRATSLLMRSFYTALYANGGNSSRALRTAKRELASTRRYSDPVYWAGFVLDSSNQRLDQKAL